MYKHPRNVSIRFQKDISSRTRDINSFINFGITQSFICCTCYNPSGRNDSVQLYIELDVLFHFIVRVIQWWVLLLILMFPFYYTALFSCFEYLPLLPRFKLIWCLHMLLRSCYSTIPKIFVNCIIIWGIVLYDKPFYFVLKLMIKAVMLLLLDVE